MEKLSDYAVKIINGSLDVMVVIKIQKSFSFSVSEHSNHFIQFTN